MSPTGEPGVPVTAEALQGNQGFLSQDRPAGGCMGSCPMISQLPRHRRIAAKEPMATERNSGLGIHTQKHPETRQQIQREMPTYTNTRAATAGVFRGYGRSDGTGCQSVHGWTWRGRTTVEGKGGFDDERRLRASGRVAWKTASPAGVLTNARTVLDGLCCPNPGR